MAKSYTFGVSARQVHLTARRMLRRDLGGGTEGICQFAAGRTILPQRGKMKSTILLATMLRSQERKARSGIKARSG